MGNDIDAILDDLLSRWHHWSSQHEHVSGFSGVSAAFRLFRVSRQYDDTNGALDDDVEHSIMAAVHGCIEAVEQPWRTAIYIDARNLHTGISVWSSPRIPQEPIEREQFVADSRVMLAAQLHRFGVM